MAYTAMALYSHGPIKLWTYIWPYIVMDLYSYGLYSYGPTQLRPAQRPAKERSELRGHGHHAPRPVDAPLRQVQERHIHIGGRLARAMAGGCAATRRPRWRADLCQLVLGLGTARARTCTRGTLPGSGHNYI